LHEVVGPHVVGPLWPETDARPVFEPQAATFRLLLGHFEPFPAPDASRRVSPIRRSAAPHTKKRLVSSPNT
jgi:hypothetical protein